MKLSTVTFAAISLALSGTALVIEKRQTPARAYHIRPSGDTSNRIGVSGGVLAVGFDCNGTPSQKWAWWDAFDQSPLFVTHPTTKKRLCMNVADINNSTRGSRNIHLDELWAKANISREDIWFWVPSSLAPYNQMCLDLTDGSKENRNVLQTW
ncbi:hypothetical protein BDV98DRAFT_585347 [Pterulicium gracile]|uniref:Ricin B lectin domain-containing protein n=1 Tax=Pterulicium gracile TaxID=1884261 RepID=A0A5C3QHL0_9AGAR|nr:hypothetical protein BDV98DRAFT_585347 [Pterula gracilis]